MAAVAAVVDGADLGVEAAHLGLENQLDRTQLQVPPAPGRLVIDRGGRPAARAGQPPRPAARPLVLTKRADTLPRISPTSRLNPPPTPQKPERSRIFDQPMAAWGPIDRSVYMVSLTR